MFPPLLWYTCRSSVFRFYLICKRLAGIIRHVGTEDIQEAYSTGQPFTHRSATRGAIPVWFFFQSSSNNSHYFIHQTPEIRLYGRLVSHFAPCTEVRTCWLKNGSDGSHTSGDVARAGIRMILRLYTMYEYHARHLAVPPLVKQWERDNPSGSAIVCS